MDTSVITITSFSNIAYYKLPSEYKGLGEAHAPWELVYCDQGKVLIQADNKKFILPSGSIVFHKPYEYHDVWPFDGTQSSIIVIGFYTSSESMSFFNKQVLQLDTQEKNYLRTIATEADAAYKYFENEPPYYKLQLRDDAPCGAVQYISQLFSCFLILILRRIITSDLNYKNYTSNASNRKIEIVSKVNEYLNVHLPEKIQLKDIAKELNISTSLLKQVYKQITGTTVMKQYSSLRISLAKSYIRKSKMTFTQIAAELGYDNLYYFSNQFREKTGMTPTEYARSVRH